MKPELCIFAIIVIGIIIVILYRSSDEPAQFIMRDEPSYKNNSSSNSSEYYGIESFILVDKENFSAPRISAPSIPGIKDDKKNGKKSKTDESKDKAKSQVESKLADKKQDIVAKGKKYSEKANQIISKINNKMFGWLE